MAVEAAALRSFGLAGEAVQDAAVPTTPITKLNPKALEALKLLTQLPEYKTQVSPERQSKINAILAGVGPDNRLYKYGKDYWRRGPIEAIQEKLPFQAQEKYAPGERSFFGDIFDRSGAGMRNAVRVLRQPETLAASERTVMGQPVNIGLPAAIGAFKEGFETPTKIERFQNETIDEYYNRIAKSGRAPSAGEVLIGGSIASARGLTKDILTNPADIASIIAPIPKPIARLGEVPLGKGFMAGARTALQSSKATPTGVATAEDAIRATLQKPIEPPPPEVPIGTQGELFPNMAPTFAPAVAAKLPKVKPVRDFGGQQIFPFAKRRPATLEQQGQMELGLEPGMPKPPTRQGQQSFRFYRRGVKPGEGIMSPSVKEPPAPVKLPPAAVKPQFTTGYEPKLLDYLNQHFTDYELVRRMPAAERLRLGNLTSAQLRDEIAAMKNVKLPPVKAVPEAKTPFGKKMQAQAIEGENVPLHPAQAGRAAEAARGTNIFNKRGQTRFEQMSEMELKARLVAAQRAGNTMMENTYRQALSNKGKLPPVKVPSRNPLRNNKGQAQWSELTPEQQQAILKSGMPLETVDKLFGLKKGMQSAAAPKPVEGTAAPQIFKRKTKVSKNIGKMAQDVNSEHYGRIVAESTSPEGTKMYTITGGSLGSERVTLPRTQLRVSQTKPASGNPLIPLEKAVPQFDEVKMIESKATPKPKSMEVDPKAAIRAEHAALKDQIIALTAKNPKPGTKEHLKLAMMKRQYSKLGKEVALSDAERVKATREGRQMIGKVQLMDGFESFANPLRKLEEETGTWRPFGGPKEPSPTKSTDKNTDDLVSAFKNLLPEIIEDVKTNGGTVMDRIKAVTDNVAVQKILEKEVGNSAAAAKAEIQRLGNWNVKSFSGRLKTALEDMAKADPTFTKKIAHVSDEEVAKIAANLTDTPTMRAILKTKPGQMAGEVRKFTDDAASALRAVLKEDFGPDGLMKQIKNVVKEKFKQRAELNDRMGRAFRQLQLDANEQAEIKTLLENIRAKYKKDPFLSPDDYAIINNQLIKLEHDLFNSTKWREGFDKAYYIWLNSLLSNPFTHGVNFMSNAMFLLEKVPNRAFDILGDYTIRGLARMKGVKLPQKYQWKEIPAMWRGLGRWAEKKATGKALPFKVQKGTKLDTDIPSPLSKSVDKILGQPVRLLKKGDDIFKEAVGYAEFYARHVMGERGDDLLNSIYQEQLVRTFQDEAGPLARWLLEGKKRVPGLKWVIPFIKTPERLLMRGLERTPVGAAGKLVRDLAKGMPQKTISHDIGLVYESALLTLGIGWLWQQGRVVGDAPNDEAARAAFYESGKKPNSIKIGDYWVPFARMEPLGTALSLMVNFTQDVANSEADMPQDKIAEAIGGITQTLANKTYFSGVLGFMRAASEPHIYGGKLLSKFVGSLAPGAVKFITDIMDPIYRDAEGLTGELAKRTPFLSTTVEPSLGVFGDEQRKTPFGIGKEKTDRLTRALKDTPVPMPSDRLGGKKLHKKEYNEILRKSGPYLKQALIDLTSSPEWEKTPRGMRAKIVEEAARDIRGAFREELQMRKIAEEMRKDPQKYINSILK